MSSQQRHRDDRCLVCAADRLREALTHIARVVALTRAELPVHAAERHLDDLTDDLDNARSRITLALAVLEDVE